MTKGHIFDVLTRMAQKANVNINTNINADSILETERAYKKISFLNIKDQEMKKLFGRKYLNEDFNTFKTETENQKKILNISKKIAYKLKESINSNILVAFIGTPGTGKDHIAKSIISDIWNNDLTVIHTTVREMSRAIRQAKEILNMNEQEAINYYSEADILIINEIGVQSMTDFEKANIFEVVNNIDRKEKNCIFISNEDEAGFKKCIDFEGQNRVWDRLQGRIIIFEGQSYRKVKL